MTEKSFSLKTEEERKEDFLLWLETRKLELNSYIENGNCLACTNYVFCNLDLRGTKVKKDCFEAPRSILRGLLEYRESSNAFEIKYDNIV